VFLLRFNPDVDDRVLAAVWASWLDKVLLRPDVPLAIEQHLATTLVLACDSIKSKSGAHKLWGAFIDLIAERYGSFMDEKREREVREAVGESIATFANEKAEYRQRANDLLAAVRMGLTEGTADDDHVLRGYDKKRTEEFARPKRPQ
jgi:hypothetical protein